MVTGTFQFVFQAPSGDIVPPSRMSITTCESEVGLSV